MNGPIGESLVPEVEVAALGQPFGGSPTARGEAIAAGGTVEARIVLDKLAPGRYRWQARLRRAQATGSGEWAKFADGEPAFGIAGRPPALDRVALSGARPFGDGAWIVGRDDRPSLEWRVAADQPASVAQVVYRIDRGDDAPVSPPSDGERVAADLGASSLPHLEDGSWKAHLWAIDRAGQTSAPVTVAFTVLRTPPEVNGVVFRSWVFNPEHQKAPIRFRLSQPASVTVWILPTDSGTPVRTYQLGRQPTKGEIRVEWDGRDETGRPVPTGTYRFMVRAVDQAGNADEKLYVGLQVTDKVIRVHLDQQRLTAHQGPKQVMTTLVTTGGQELPTPTGSFEVLSKEAPFTFRSPWPPGHRYWYPDVRSNYAMLFYLEDADFIHDAPWRSVYGPGTNGPGTPGQTYTGSHGCVELPTSAMAELFAWAPLGTPVVVSR